MSWRVENEGGARRVVVTKELPGRRWIEILRGADCEIAIGTLRRRLEVTEIAEAIGSRCDGAIGQLTEPWGAELFERLRRAGGKVYSNYAVGYDNVDVRAATERGIAVGNTPGVLTETTAEMAVALTFAAARRIGEAERFLRAGKFEGWLPDLFLGKRLWGGTLGVIGAGRIGTAYALMMAPAHRMHCIYWDLVPNPRLEDAMSKYSQVIVEQGGRPLECRFARDLEELLRASDVVSLHVPLTDATRHLINRERLRCMKPDAVLVNTSRGAVIDEAALVEHLRSHPDFRAGLDVFEHEPRLTPGLAELENAVLVPHIASATVWTREGMAVLAALNVAGILEGYPVSEELDVERFLGGDPPRLCPSIVNARDLGLPTSR